MDTVESGATLGEYLRRTGQRLEQATPSGLRVRGHIVYLRLRVEGRKHGDLALDQVLHRASTRRRIRDQGATRDALFRPDTPNEKWISQVFVLDPGYGYPVFVRFELFDRDALLAFADTRPLPHFR